MKKVIVPSEINEDTVNVELIDRSIPIFAKREGQLAGMLVNETSGGFQADRWILRIGGSGGCSGHHDNRTACMQSAEGLGFEFFVE